MMNIEELKKKELLKEEALKFAKEASPTNFGIRSILKNSGFFKHVIEWMVRFAISEPVKLYHNPEIVKLNDKVKSSVETVDHMKEVTDNYEKALQETIATLELIRDHQVIGGYNNDYHALKNRARECLTKIK